MVRKVIKDARKAARLRLLLLFLLISITVVAVKIGYGLFCSPIRKLGRINLAFDGEGKNFSWGTLTSDGFRVKEGSSATVRAPFFGSFYNDQKNDFSSPNFFKQMIKDSFFGKIKTSFNRSDLFWLYWRSRGVKITDWKDGFADAKLRGDGLATMILNGTDHTGLAQEAAGLIENCGGRVIVVADSSEKTKNTTLLVKKEYLKSYTAWWLEQVFSVKAGELKEENDRGDVILTVGENYWEKMSKKW